MLWDMPFDPAVFEAEVVLKLIPTERFPLLAQEALEAGFDGPKVLRMAILDPGYGWEIDEALPAMVAELGGCSISRLEAALRLARLRAERILANHEDPLLSCDYFYQLYVAADHPSELATLGYLDEYVFYTTDAATKSREAREYLEEFLSPQLRAQRELESENPAQGKD